jgi:hypothetical protein
MNQRNLIEELPAGTLSKGNDRAFTSPLPVAPAIGLKVKKL